MTLRRQLLLASLLLLSLPWAGCQFVREMEGAMRDGQAQSLQATARAIAAGLSSQTQLLYPEPARLLHPENRGNELYASPTPAPIILDGYGDGWPAVTRREFADPDGGDGFAVSYQAATRDGKLFLLLRIEDPEVRYYNPAHAALSNGDRLVLRMGSAARPTDYVLFTAAPGVVQVYRRDPGGATRDRRIEGIWQDSNVGYTLELMLPLALLGGRLGLYVVNSSDSGEEQTLGNIAPGDRGPPPWLVDFPEALGVALARFSSPGLHLQVIDHAQWVIGQTSAAAPQRRSGSADNTFWLLRTLYRGILVPHPYRLSAQHGAPGRRSTPEVLSALAGTEALAWYKSPAREEQTVIAAAAPIMQGNRVIGAVLAEQNSEEYLSLTDRAVSRLMLYSLLAVGLSTTGLLAFAALLSWRIRRLSEATRHVVQEDGRLLPENFPRSQRGDEIGELSRRYAELLERLQEYHDYLRSLSRKLSHELRTPIAVIQSSLEHVQQAGADETGVYLARAREGLQRLNAILAAMSEATRLEESIQGNATELFDLAALLRQVTEAYRDVYPQHRIELRCPAAAVPVQGTPELVVQLLDKLLDNATSFAPLDSTVSIALAAAGSHWQLDVSNLGPPLPEAMQHQLFDSMVSVRPTTGDQVHLGLGLHIARLIAAFHGGSIKARNLADGSGVCFSLLLPKPGESQAGSAPVLERA